jgi:predicted enzyme involved in methoxymalonyl-ACP biosynthesis
LDEISAVRQRFDVKSEMLTGFPYSLAHLEIMGKTLAWLIQPPEPRKGLITDLDDTLWQGIPGEVGAEGVFWDLEHEAQMRGLYQQTLGSLAESETLIAAFST